MSKKVLKAINLFFEENRGVVGTPTPIKDKDGVELKVGDLVYLEHICEDGSICHTTSFIVFDEESEKYYASGSLDMFNKDGTYTNITIKKVKGCEELKVKDWIHAGAARIEVEEEADE